jgi:hypothetical protein
MLLSPQIKVTEKNELLTRRMPPFVVGIIKGVLLHPVTSTQGLAVIEPAYHLRDFLKSIVSKLRGAGIDIELGKEP